MHDLSCSLRPKPNGALTPSDGLGPTRLDRGDPFPELVADWQELIAFDITVNATSEEGVASRLISGPFAMLEASFRSSAAGGSSQQLRIGIGDTFPAPQAVVGSDSGIPSGIVTDSSRSVGTFYATSVFERHQLAFVSQTATARLIFVLNNTTAGAVTVVGHVLIAHLVPRASRLPAPLA
jgi:hypothetical protein